jgi:hypothetical protein
MSRVGGAVRVSEDIRALEAELKGLLDGFPRNVDAGPDDIDELFSLYNTLTACYTYLAAMRDYAERGGRSRGSALYYDPDGVLPEGLPEIFRHSPDDGSKDGYIQEAELTQDGVAFNWREVRPIPEGDGFFENEWRGYRENGNVF